MKGERELSAAESGLITNLTLLARYQACKQRPGSLMTVTEAEREEMSKWVEITPEQEQKKLYLIGSLRNPTVPELASRLRKSVPDCEIFDDWYAAGEEADDKWKAYEQARGRTYHEALEGYAAKHVFEFDKHHLDTSTHCLLVLPAGKSGHMELMYAAYGVGAQAAILLEQGADPRWDVMYQFVDNVFSTPDEVEAWLQ